MTRRELLGVIGASSASAAPDPKPRYYSVDEAIAALGGSGDPDCDDIAMTLGHHLRTAAVAWPTPSRRERSGHSFNGWQTDMWRR